MYALIYIVGFVPESMLPKVTSGLAKLLLFLKTEAAHVTLINIKIFDPSLSEKAACDMCLSSLSNSLMLIYELSKLRFSSRLDSETFIQDVENIDILPVYICIFEYHSIIFELSTRPFDTRSDSHSTNF